MYQPRLRMRDEDYAVLSSAELWDLELPDGAVVPEPVPVPTLRHEVAFEDLDRALVEHRTREARLLVALLAALHAAEDDTIDRFGRQSLERNEAMDKAFRCEAALALDIGDAEVTTLIHHLETAERWLPRTWAAVRAGRGSRRALQAIVRKMDGLDLDLHAAAYDAAAVDALERTPGPRIPRRMHVVRERLQADTAIERRRRAEADRRTEVAVGRDGIASWTLTGPAEQVLAVEDAVTRRAIAQHGEQGETRSIGAIKYDLAMNRFFGQDQTPITATVTVTVPVLSLLGQGTAPATLDGYGPIDLDTAKRLMGDASCLTRVLTDPHTGIRLAMSRRTYRIPAAMRRWLQLRDGTCRFPGCGRPAVRCDIDHRDEWWADDGETDVDNLAHLCRKHHRLKSTGMIRVECDPDTGNCIWHLRTNRRWISPPAPPEEPIT